MAAEALPAGAPLLPLSEAVVDDSPPLGAPLLAAADAVDVSAGADLHFISQLKVGSRVAARFRASDPTLSASLCPNWYEGRVVELTEDGTFRIHYDDGDKEDGVLPRFMRPPKNG